MDTRVRVIIPSGYVGVIHVKSGLAMEGIVTITGIIDADFCGEIGLMMHNVTETDYKVLKENPLAQLVVYKVDRLPVIYHASGHTSLKADLQVVCREKGFGEVTTLLPAELADDLSDCKIPCSGAQAHELWQPPAKSVITSRHRFHTTVPTNANPLAPIPSAPCKKRPVVPPKLVAQWSLCTSKLVQSAPRVLFQDTRESSTDSDDLLFCDSPALSSLINDVCDDGDDGLSTTKHRNGEKDLHESGMGVEPTHQVT